jgi:5-hydroxyisourate hydrolase
MSQITTHILDTTKGRPAENVQIILYADTNGNWMEVARGRTNEDGRIKDLLPGEKILDKGIYKLRFETRDYFGKQSVETFYPFIEIVFDLSSSEHYHVPLLLNPFGYTTYRGS